jgi:hypothetical protein
MKVFKTAVIHFAGKDPVHLDYHVCSPGRLLEHALVGTPDIARIDRLEILELTGKCRKV